MRKILLSLCLTALPFVVSAEQKSIMVVSDMHVLDTLLFDINDCQFLQNDHKLAEKSHELWDTVVNRVLCYSPDILLVPGDLTYNGEKLSHLTVAKGLERIRQNGTQVYVVPGNHDVSDPAAHNLYKHTGIPAENISAEDFALLYSNFGYGDAVVRLDNQTDSLSYMAYPSDDMAIIAVNSNQSNIGGHKSAGGITTSILEFIQSCAAKALNEGHTNILLITHHPVMVHCDGQAKIDKSHVGNQLEQYIPLDELQEALTEAHIHAVFSGHAHVNSIAQVETTNGLLFDVLTGSASAYPFPMRHCTLNTNTGEMEITGEEITLYQAEGYERDSLLAKGAVNSMTDLIYPHYTSFLDKINKNILLKAALNKYGITFNNIDKEELKELVWVNMGQELHHALSAFSRGDENIYFEGDSAYNAAISSYERMFSLFFGGAEININTIMPVFEKYDLVPDFGFSPEEVFGSIYGNYVTYDEHKIVTADAACTIQNDIDIREQDAQPTNVETINNNTRHIVKTLDNGRVIINIGDKRININGMAE